MWIFCCCDANVEQVIDGEMQAELNDLSSDIELKTKLIEELEKSQQRMQTMRQHYEEKLNVLNVKIINTQLERDQVLANMGAGKFNQYSIEANLTIITFFVNSRSCNPAK